MLIEIYPETLMIQREDVIMRKLKHFKWQSMIAAVLYLIAGLLLLFYPQNVADLVCNLVGIGMMVYGAVLMISYFMMDLQDSLFRNDFVFGIVWILLGILIVKEKTIFQTMIPFIMGIMIISSGFLKLQDGIDAIRMGYPKSWVYLIMASISIVLGLVILFNLLSANTLLYQIIGACLIYCGITDLYFTITLSSKIRKFIGKAEQAAKGLNGDVMDSETGAPLHQPEDIPVSDDSESDSGTIDAEYEEKDSRRD